MVKPFSSLPGPRSYPLLGTVPHYLSGKYSRDKMHVMGMSKYKEFGPIVRETVLPGTDVVWLFDPDDVKTMYDVEGPCPARRSHIALQHYRVVQNKDRFDSAGLLPTNGPAWAKMRKEFQPMLRPTVVEKFLPQTQEVCRDFVGMLEKRVVDGQFSSGDFLEELKKYFLEVSAYFLFDTRLGAIQEDLDKNGAPYRLMNAALSTNDNILHTDNGLPLWKVLETKAYREIREGQECIEEITEKLLSSRDDIPRLPNGGRDLSRKDVFTFFADMTLAGIDTGSYTTGFLLYHLARNPEAQEKLRADCRVEDDANLLRRFGYGKMVLKESLRLNPISIGVGRISPVDAVFSGYEVPKGTVLVSQNQVTCRLPQYFSRPDDFIPERWDRKTKRKDNSGAIHPYLSLPFGFGPRMCIGRRLAEQSILVLVNGLFSRFRVKWAGDQESELDCLSTLINKPEKPLRFEFENVN